MKRKKQYCLRPWELALLLSLCFSLCAGAWASNTQSELAQKLVRLHVVAASDDETEQDIKLRVRDAVLEYLEPRLEAETTADGAAEAIESDLDGLRKAAESAAEGRSVAVSLCREAFPTRDYDTFSLPAGQYMSLRVTLGQGEGRNWWCVVFPPLCMEGALGGGETVAALDDEELEIITATDGEYELKFKLLELWGRIAALFDGA